MILVEWIVSSVFTYIYTYFALQGRTSFNFLPVLYWDVCYLIYLFPILGIKIKTIETSYKFINYSIVILTFLGVLSLVPLSENLIYLVRNYSAQSSSILEMYEDKMDVDNKVNLISWMSPIGLFLHNIISKFTYPALILFFIITTKRTYISGKRFLIIICLFANTICFTLNGSGRGGVVEFFLVTVILFILFRKIIILKISRTMQILVLFAVVGIVSCMVVLSLIRSNSVANEGEEWIVTSLYLGEGQVNFFEDMWNCKVSAQGDYNFSYIKDLFGFDTFTNYLERREFWNISKVGYDPVRFYTFIGCWFADLKYFTIIFILVISWLFHKMIKKCNGIFNPISLFAVFVYLDILVMGFSIFNFMIYPKFRQTIVSFIYLSILYYITKGKNNGGRNHSVLSSSVSSVQGE